VDATIADATATLLLLPLLLLLLSPQIRSILPCDCTTVEKRLFAQTQKHDLPDVEVPNTEIEKF